MTSEDWIKVLRERTHKLNTTAATLELTTAQLAKRVNELHAEVRRMATADEIAKGVADELRRRAQTEREKIDSGMRWLVWVFGIVLAGLQIAQIVVFHH